MGQYFSLPFTTNKIHCNALESAGNNCSHLTTVNAKSSKRDPKVMKAG